MLFNSIEFAIFLPLVFLIYWFVFPKNRSLQNAFLLVASYVFYGWWDWRFLVLIAFTSLTDYLIGNRMHRIQEKKKRRTLLGISLLINLGMLGFFKYFNFFTESFSEAFRLFGKSMDSPTLHIILPVGISFYTFQSLSYILDIYHKRLEPEKNPVTFFAFVSFFPQLVAGPIERAANLLPQFNRNRQFDTALAKDGMRQIAWGLFKKVVIADNLADYVNEVFSGYSDYSGSTLFLAAILFAFQIYGDFSGYSDMASGTAKLMGFRLMRNFNYPYFSRSIPEFWRRWHISLSNWFRDYLFYPLGAGYGSRLRTVRNILVVFAISGLWHGANKTFLIWGCLHGLFMLFWIFIPQTRKITPVAGGKNLFPSLSEVFQILLTFLIVVIAWVFFRAESLPKALAFLEHIVTGGFLSIPYVYSVKLYLIPLLFMVILEWFRRHREHPLSMKNESSFQRRLLDALVILLIFVFGDFSDQAFIYFQF